MPSKPMYHDYVVQQTFVGQQRAVLRFVLLDNRDIGQLEDVKSPQGCTIILTMPRAARSTRVTEYYLPSYFMGLSGKFLELTVTIDQYVIVKDLHPR